MPLSKLECTIKSVGAPTKSAFAAEGDTALQVAVKFDYVEQGTFYLAEDDPRIVAFTEQIGKTKLVTVNVSKTGKIYLAD